MDILGQRLIPQLPKSSKTFLRTTSAKYIIKHIEDGQFVYCGIQEGLQNINTTLHNEEIRLILNVDGMPLFHSSLQQLWTILAKIDYYPDIYKPFPVAIYCGDKKPSNLNLFLEDFIHEINVLYDGIEINGKQFKVSIAYFTCDTPARAFLKQCKGHTAYFACERYLIRGERFEGRMIYECGNYNPRTNISFRMQEQPEHHTGISPLLQINPPIDMINQFVLDFMHLCCIGVMKKLLEYWLDNSKFKLSYSQKKILNERSAAMSRQIPCEYQRKTRSLVKYFSKLKATELRFILLYSGPLLFKNLLQPKVYKHFLLFHVSCRLLSSDEYAFRYLERVKVYLEKFVKLSKKYYGKRSQTINMHNLIHLVDDTNFKCTLSKMTCFPFESTLGYIKRLVRSGNHVLPQICRRLHENYLINREVSTIPSEIQIMKEKLINDNFDIIALKYKEFTIKRTYPDNNLILHDGTCIMVERISRPVNSLDIIISGTKFEKEGAMYTYPFNSTRIDEWKIKSTKSIQKIQVQITEVKCKLIYLYTKDKPYNKKRSCIMPLLHTE